ncbi:hypothetical protein H7F15_13055 [Pontibacter sp. Tf4]|uniref:hypothetical protein n=1 Tax=Pontibacter sp. Tf4 TaxID=2761620 RepID=UPI001628A719|nr:hypothetical protein [Pontibacter sp. Tf4]MBB6611972.1 hypothetical protein [Pontibacter sp. Tf4]
MQEIQQLFKVLYNVSSKPGTTAISHKQKGLEGIFIQGVTQGKYLSDSDAAYQLYGTDQGDVRYKMLKHRLKKKLYNALLTVEIDNNKGQLQKEVECARLLTIAKLLSKQTEYNLVLTLCSKAIAISQEYQFNDLLLSAYELELSTLTNQGTLKTYNSKRNTYLQQLKIVSLEKEALSFYQLAKAHLRSTVKVRKALLAELPRIIERLTEIASEIQSFESFLAYYKTSILYYELTGNFSKIISVTQEASDKIASGQISKERFDMAYNAYILVYAHLRAKSYTQGLIYASDYYNLFDITTKNWFAYMENYFLLAVHARQYELAVILLHRVRANTNFNTISSDSKERWQLYTAYLFFINPAAPVLKNFNYQSFITSITEYSKDKQGFNVAILILQFIYFLKKGDSEGLLYRIESLKKYILTHLKDSFSLRSKLFLKLLMLTVTEGFDATSCRAKGAKHYQKLMETPTPGDAYAEIEIVPYEHLWELILEEMPKAGV